MIEAIKSELWLLEDDGEMIEHWRLQLPPNFVLQVFCSMADLESALTRRQADGKSLPSWLVLDRFIGESDTVGDASAKRLRGLYAFGGRILLSSDLPAREQELQAAGFDGQIKKAFLNSKTLAKSLGVP